MINKLKINYFTSNGIKYLRPDSKYLNQYVKFINKNKVKAIDINNTAGYWSKNIDFLIDCPNVEYLSITNNDTDISVVSKMTKLKEISSNSNPNRIIDLNLFSQIETLSIDSHKNWVNLESCSSLKNLRLYKLNRKDLSDYYRLRNLESLHLNQCKIESLEGLENFVMLKELKGFYLNKLTDLSLKKEMPLVKKIHFESCKKIQNLEELVRFINIEVLYLLYCSPQVESVKFLDLFPKLKKVSLKGMTILDGDTSVFKKFYSHEYKDLEL